MTDKQIKEFVLLVDTMRKAQKEYFRGRMGRDLEKSKKLEKEVDDMIREIEREENDKLQLKLF